MNVGNRIENMIQLYSFLKKRTSKLISCLYDTSLCEQTMYGVPLDSRRFSSPSLPLPTSISMIYGPETSVFETGTDKERRKPEQSVGQVWVKGMAGVSMIYRGRNGILGEERGSS